MSTKRILFIVLVASAVMLAVGIGPRVIGNAQASPPAQKPDPAGVTIPYPGRLSDQAGRPVPDGAYDFTFTLYDAPTGGEPLWSETQEGVVVKEGAFVASLGDVNPIPSALVEGSGRWLEVGVRGPGEAEFTPLSPRQRLISASPDVPSSPSAGTTCPHDHFGEKWNGTGVDVGLHISNDVGYAFEGWSSNNVGILGVSTPGFIIAPSGNYGVYGIGGTSGVYGYSESAFGVVAEGNDSSGYDRYGDLVLGGDRGEIFTSNGSSLDLYSDKDVYIDLDDDSNGDHCFVVLDGDNNIVGQWCEDGTKSAVVQTGEYGQRAVYSIESPEVWLEDFGTATLTDGAVKVSIDPLFAKTINLEEEYHVFLTPLGDCRGLYVAAKTATYFEVRELGGGASNIAFDYRIVAKRLGLEDLRLEPVPDAK